MKQAARAGHPVPDYVKNFQWTPEAWKQMQDTGRTLQQRVVSQQNDIKIKAENDLKERQGKLDDQRAETEKYKQQELKTRAEKDMKVSGAKAPTKEERDTILNLIRHDYPDLPNENATGSTFKNHEAELMAEIGADRVQSLLQRNPGLSRDQAAAQVYAGMLSNKEITSENMTHTNWFRPDTTSKVMHVNPSGATSQPNAPKISNAADYAKIPSKSHYIDPDGIERVKP